MTVFGNFEVMFGRKLNYFVYNSVILYSVIYLQAIYLVKFEIIIFSWFDNGIILKH
jgi:hypothetical protein